MTDTPEGAMSVGEYTVFAMRQAQAEITRLREQIAAADERQRAAVLAERERIFQSVGECLAGMTYDDVSPAARGKIGTAIRNRTEGGE